jgi:general secretion pathway protein G
MPNKIQVRGFTLMELLLVMVIIIALFALLSPALLNTQKNANIKRATIQIKNFEGALEQYATENRGYPTTEMGLDTLIFLPDNYGQNPMGMQNGMMTQPGVNPNGTPGAFAGNAVSVGPEMLGNGMGINPMNPAMSGGTNPMGGGTNPMINPMGTGTGITDVMGNPTGATGMSGMGMTGMSNWNQPFSNPQLYTQKRQRSTKYLDFNEIPTDPWGQPYRYDNSMPYYGLNQTGTVQPAIWSAGPDKQDNTDDDIRNWEPAVAQNLIAQKQQQMQGGMQGGIQGGTMNPMGGAMGGMGTTDPMGNPMGTGMNPAMPMGTNPMGTPAMPMGTNPMGMGMNPAMPIGANPMGTPTMPMGTNPMGTPTNP